MMISVNCILSISQRGDLYPSMAVQGPPAATPALAPPTVVYGSSSLYLCWKASLSGEAEN